MIKKIITIVLTMSLITTFSNITNIYAYEENNKKISKKVLNIVHKSVIITLVKNNEQCSIK